MEICLERNPKEFLSKSTEIGLESSGSMFLMESLRNSFQYQWELVWRESSWNSFQNQWKLVWRALGQFRPISQWNPFGIPFKINGNWFGENPYGIPFKINGNWSGELLPRTPGARVRGWASHPRTLAPGVRGKSSPSEPRTLAPSHHEDEGLESSRSISNWNPWGIPFNINGNWSGELLVNFPMESLRNSFQYQWKLVWRTLGQLPNGILDEFLSITMEIGLERILMECLLKSMEIGLESSWSVFIWSPLCWNSFQNQWKFVWRALGQCPNGILKEFLSITMEIGLERILMEFLSKSMAINLESSWWISQWNP